MQRPAPKYDVLDRVVATRRDGLLVTATVLWRYWLKPSKWRITCDGTGWLYVLLCAEDRYASSVLEELLAPTGQVDDPKALVGTKEEFSLDTEVNPSSPVHEGCYRLAGGLWTAWVVRAVPTSAVREGRMVRDVESDIEFLQFDVDSATEVSEDWLAGLFAEFFHRPRFTLVFGPDSLCLRSN